MKKNFLKSSICFIIFFGLTFFLVQPVIAGGLDEAFGSKFLDAAGGMGYNTGNDALNLQGYIAVVIRMALSLLGVIFLVLLIYGGFIWMTAKGNEQQAEKAMGIIYMAVIGLIIVLAAYAVSYFFVYYLSEASLKSV